METLCQDPVLECQICFHVFSPRRRPKLLSCRHTLCSVCLAHMRRAHREIRCPWCRGVTELPAGVPVSHLPDDPAAITVVTASPHAPVYIRLPSCYVPPPAEDRVLPGECRFGLKGVAAVAEDAPERRGVAAAAAAGGSAWSGVCTVILVACVLLFLLGIVLHNMSCISKRFTVISCG